MPDCMLSERLAAVGIRRCQHDRPTRVSFSTNQTRQVVSLETGAKGLRYAEVLVLPAN